MEVIMNIVKFYLLLKLHNSQTLKKFVLGIELVLLTT